MYVSTLHLSNFRNYQELDLHLHPGVTLFLGPNGQGKTNIVEAINYFAIVGSHRTTEQAALVRAHTNFAIIRALLKHDKREALLETQINRVGVNKAQVNKSPAKMKDFPRYISTVLFSPEDLQLVRGEPAHRRKFLDDYIAMKSPKFAGTLSDYERVLKQRNTLLKSAAATGKKFDPTTLDVWDEKLTELASHIYMERRLFLTELSPLFIEAYQHIAGQEQRIALSLISSVTVTAEYSQREYQEAHLDQLRESRATELDRGMTLSGPHRDDADFQLNEMSVKAHASHGESWSFALSLKLATAHLLRRDSRVGDPILILDDVFAELDSPRRERLAGAIVSFEQTLITAAVSEDVPQNLNPHVYRVHQGAVTDE